MRINLPSGAVAEIDKSATKPVMGLVIAPDIFGLRPLFDDLVSRLAKEWNMAVAAVEPFTDIAAGADVEARFAAMATLNDDVQLRNLLEAADALGTSRVGLIGFCMGGMYCHKAASIDRFAKISSFYGMIHVPEGWRSATQGDPIEFLTAGNADRVMAIVGEQDPYTPHDHVDELRMVGVTVRAYPEANHGFAHDASRPAHRSADAADAFAATKNWLLAK